MGHIFMYFAVVLFYFTDFICLAVHFSCLCLCANFEDKNKGLQADFKDFALLCCLYVSMLLTYTIYLPKGTNRKHFNENGVQGK